MCGALNDGSVCVRLDDKNTSALRAVIFPSVDTPYGGGAFEFDIHLPPVWRGSFYGWYATWRINILEEDC